MLNSGRTLEVAAVDAEKMSQLKYLQQVGFVDGLIDDTSNSSKWWLTDEGLGHLTHTRCLVSPQPVLRCRVGLSLEDSTNWELLALMREQGWALTPIPNKKKVKLALPPYTKGSARMCYSNHIDLTVVRPYLLALLKADALFEGGVLLEVHHHKQNNYYKRVCSGTFSGQVEPLALTDGAQATFVDLEPDGGSAALMVAAGNEDGVLPLPRPPKAAEAEEMVVDGSGDEGSEAGSLVIDVLDIGHATPVAGESGDEPEPPPALPPLGPLPGDPENTDVLAALPPAPGPARRRRGRGQHHTDTGTGVGVGRGSKDLDPRSIPDWGGQFYLTFSQSSSYRFGRWMARCPHHRKNVHTPCTRTATLTCPEDFDTMR